MKAGILYADRDIRLGDAPEPRIKPDEVLVETGYAGICGTDLHIYRGEFHEPRQVPRHPGPRVRRHHPRGGQGRQGLQGGRPRRRRPDHLLPHLPGLPDRATSMRAARSSCWGLTSTAASASTWPRPPAMSFLLPDSIPMQYAPMVEMYGLGHHVLLRGQVQPGETVVILGAGKLGLSVLDVLCHSANAGPDHRHRPAALPPGDRAQSWARMSPSTSSTRTRCSA